MNWENKFNGALDARNEIKKRMRKTVDMNATYSVNTNVNQGTSSYFNTDRKLQDHTVYTGGQIRAPASTFTKVMKERKSRGSTRSPLVCDIDYKGDSGKFSHMITKDGNQTQLSFGMNLRNYKSIDKAQHNEPFIYPQKAEYRPEK